MWMRLVQRPKICISLKRCETARKALVFLQLVEREGLLTRCGAILFSSERHDCLPPTMLLTAFAQAKPMPASVFAVLSRSACILAAASLFRAAVLLSEARIHVRCDSVEAMMTCCISARPNVRAKRAATAGHQAQGGENVQRTTDLGLVACRWRSA